jgi:hypothetical protein
MDDLIRQNFGPGESLWNPKCFDRLYTLREGSKVQGPERSRRRLRLLALCTLQKWGRDGWILGDLCVAEKRKGLATRLVNKVLSKVKEPIWVDANEQSNGIFLKDPRWTRARENPWEPSGTSFVASRREIISPYGTYGTPS